MAAVVTGNALEKITLFVSAKNLAYRKIVRNGVPNPFAVVSRLSDSTPQTYETVGITEVIVNCADVNWVTSYSLDYNFERNESFRVDIYHQSSSAPPSDVTKHTHIGTVDFVLSNLMRAPSQSLSLPIPTCERGVVTVKAEVQTYSRDNFVVTFAASKLSNKEGFFSRSDPFLEIARLNEDNTWSSVWKNEYVRSSLNPRWATAKIPMVTLCNGDIDRPLRITVWDWEKSGRHKFMGKVETSVREMITVNGGPLFVIEPEKKAKSKSYKHSGTLSAGKCFIEHNPTFGDFIAGGCELSLIVAIDFTGSNGDPNMPSSLHYVDPSGRLNQYQDVISTVGSVLEAYDTDKMFPVFGFGARVRLPDGTHSPAQHCFPVYGSSTEVQGVQGILQAYKDAVHNVMFSGPTLFAPLIHNAAQIAASKGCNAEKQNYTILLIITDGVINDLEATKAALVSASLQPLSVIIVGVGSADFSGMDELDSDKIMLSAGGKMAVRDIVQFVAYRDVVGKGSHALAHQVLAEIPSQFLQYFNQNKIAAKPRTVETEIRAAEAAPEVHA